MKRDLFLFLDDILDSIKNIETFMKNISKSSFSKNREKQSAVIRELEIIGEAAKNIPESFRVKHQKIPWKDISGFRDVLIHEYFGIILDRVWNVIKKDLPNLKKEILKIKKELKRKFG